MKLKKKSKVIEEFGDFQTPRVLADKILRLISNLGIRPKAIIEPTCGVGALAISASEVFVGVDIYASDINSDYITLLQAKINESTKILPIVSDFFTYDWQSLISEIRGSILVLGNYPWVTSSALSLIGGSNLPEKSNFHSRKGLDAITGKSNFDISEWMLLKNIQWFANRPGSIAMICKNSVARKVLLNVWQQSIPNFESRIYRINALQYFGVNVDACLLFIDLNDKSQSSKICKVYDSLEHIDFSTQFGEINGINVSNAKIFSKNSYLYGQDQNHTWRSGVKHDSSKIMELTSEENEYRNGLGELISLEDNYVFPMMKSSDVANGGLLTKRRYMIVPQRYSGEETLKMKRIAPKTWEYLCKYKSVLDSRASSIYKNKHPFAVFGVGDYTFKSWKIAISGFYKSINFRLIGPSNGKPVVFDDTVYFLSCDSESEARLMCVILNSELAVEFLESMIFWDEKRPITIDLLKRLNLKRLATELGYDKEYGDMLASKTGQILLNIS